MYGWLKISHHRHSGKLRPHEHTSYLPLLLLVLVVGLVLGGLTVSSVSGDSPGPQAGSIGLTGSVPKAPPKTAATIDNPTQGQHFSKSPITISGKCTPQSLVEVFKNDIFAGSAPCSDKGTYSFKIDLLYGKNVLLARVYDVLNQAGPDSAKITVFYDGTPLSASGLAPLDFSGSQLLLSTDAIFRGAFPDQLLNVPISIIGGTPPFAVNVQWGDLGNSVISRSNNVTFNAGHKYKKPGTYQITIQASDAHDRVAFLMVAAVINGRVNAAPVSSVTQKPVNKLMMAWPLFGIVLATVISFWLGERREKRLLRGIGNGGPVYHPPGSPPVAPPAGQPTS
jgi:hypothetical protein